MIMRRPGLRDVTFEGIDAETGYAVGCEIKSETKSETDRFAGPEHYGISELEQLIDDGRIQYINPDKFYLYGTFTTGLEDEHTVYYKQVWLRQ